MKKLLIIFCIGIMVTLVVKYLTATKEKAAIAATKSLLDAVKEKDVDRFMQYLDYDEAVFTLNIWTETVGKSSFTVEDMRAQLKKNFEKLEIDYEIIDAEARNGPEGSEVRVTVKLKEDSEVYNRYFIMRRKNGEWKCDFMATGEENNKDVGILN